MILEPLISYPDTLLAGSDVCHFKTPLVIFFFKSLSSEMLIVELFTHGSVFAAPYTDKQVKDANCWSVRDHCAWFELAGS